MSAQYFKRACQNNSAGSGLITLRGHCSYVLEFRNNERTSTFHSARCTPMFESKSHSHSSNLNFTDSKHSHSFVVIGTGLSIATAGQLSSFAILLMDVFSVGYPQRSSCDQFIAVSSNFGPGERWFANSSSQQCQNGTYSLSYNLTKSGKFTLSFLLLKG